MGRALFTLSWGVHSFLVVSSRETATGKQVNISKRKILIKTSTPSWFCDHKDLHSSLSGSIKGW